MEKTGNEPQGVPSNVLNSTGENSLLEPTEINFLPPRAATTVGPEFDDHSRLQSEPPANPTKNSLTDSVSGGSYTIDPRFIPFSRMTSFLFTAVLFVGGLVGSLVVWWNLGENWITWLVASLCGLVILGFGLMGWIWPPIEYQHIRWRLDSAGLEIHRGVFWQHRIAIPVARLQHADISQGPVQRPFGLAKLTVYTAGTAHSSIELDGLSLESATWLRDQLIRQREALDVV